LIDQQSNHMIRRYRSFFAGYALAIHIKGQSQDYRTFSKLFNEWTFPKMYQLTLDTVLLLNYNITV
jgi:hypothetical protein